VRLLSSTVLLPTGGFRHPRGFTLGFSQVGQHVEGVGHVGSARALTLVRAPARAQCWVEDFSLRPQRPVGSSPKHSSQSTEMADVFESTSATDGFHLHGERKLHFVTSVRALR
jgi:hypothetical protein